MNEITINGVVYVPKQVESIEEVKTSEDIDHVSDYHTHVSIVKNNNNRYVLSAFIAHHNIVEWCIKQPNPLSDQISSFWFNIRITIYVSSPNWWLTSENKLFYEGELDMDILKEYVPTLIELNRLHKLAYPEHPIYNS